uniref:Transcriptional regulator MraZ n=1 Tax=Dictyoglomus thermophilum TaxID=14 RepID=A0A7C2CP46_DICTH
MFVGEYYHSLDEKGRLIIPNDFRQLLGETFYLTRGFERCLNIYTITDWNNFSQIISSFSPTDNLMRRLCRFWFSGSIQVTTDKLGRILIPSFLIEYAGLSKEVVIIGAGKHIEIWAKEKWEDFNKEENILENMNEINSKVAELWKK